MARIDTLANFITDVATAIKNKTGKTDPITPANFDIEINSIQGGGEDLTEELNTYNTELTEQEVSIQNIIGVLQNKAISGSDAQMNVFCQSEEPETKDGVWVRNNNINPEKINITNNIIAGVEMTSIESVSNLPTSLREASVCSVGTDVYIINGTTSGSTLSSIYKYDTINDTYTYAASMGYAAYGVASATDGTDIYIFGGRVSSAGRDFTFKYDTLTGNLTQLPSMPYRTGQLQAVRVEREIYLFGGYDGSLLAKALKYNIDTGEYTTLPDLPSARNCVAVCANGNTIYIAGGYTGGTLSELLAFDTITNTYRQLNPMPISAFAMGAEVYKGHIILVGGTVNDSPQQSIYAYSIANDTYKLLSSTGGHGRMDCALVDNKIYIPGGIVVGSSYSDKTDVIELESLMIDYSDTKDTLIIASTTTGKPVTITSASGIDIQCNIADAAYFSVDDNTTTIMDDIYYGDGEKWNKL